MKRKLTTRLNRLHPDLQQHMYDKQVIVKERQDQHAKENEFVFVHIFNTWEKWITGIEQKSLDQSQYI